MIEAAPVLGVAGRVARAVASVARPDAVLRVVDPRLLSPGERRRGARLRHPTDRAAYVAAHLLVRWCAALLTRRAVASLELIQRCSECGGRDHGRPSLAGLPDVYVSLAHARGAVAAAAGWGTIGVDLELTTAPGAAAMPVALSPAEQDRVRESGTPDATFLRYWVCKEALVKAGATDLDGMAGIDLSQRPEASEPGRRTADRYGALHVVDWIDTPMGAAVAVAASDPPVEFAFPGGEPVG